MDLVHYSHESFDAVCDRVGRAMKGCGIRPTAADGTPLTRSQVSPRGSRAALDGVVRREEGPELRALAEVGWLLQVEPESHLSVARTHTRPAACSAADEEVRVTVATVDSTVRIPRVAVLVAESPSRYRI